MITAKQIEEGIRKGVVHFIADPTTGSGTVCQIGEYWFYFGSKDAENKGPDEYLKNTGINDVIAKVTETLADFSGIDAFEDEYKYYEAVLVENGIVNGSQSA